MSEIIVAYWSGTGNTGAMAEYVEQGIREGVKELFRIRTGLPVHGC